jgi:hypothetical protein
MHKFCLSHVKISNPHEPRIGFCHDEVQEDEGPDNIMKDHGAPTADHTNHPMMIIKESIQLTTVSDPGSFHLKLQHQQWSLGTAHHCDDGKNDIS